MQPKQLTTLTSRVTDVYDSITDKVIDNIIKRIDTDELDMVTKDNVLKWQAKKLVELGAFTDETIARIAKESHKSTSAVKSIIETVRSTITKEVDPRLKRATHKTVSPKMTETDNMLENLARVATGKLDNIVNETLVTRNVHTNAAAMAYRKILANTAGKVLTGTQSARDAFHEAMYDWQNRGLESGLVDAAGHRWTVDGYVRTVMRSVIPQAYAQGTQKRMDDYGYSLVVYPSHATSRPACAPIQGQVVNLKREGERGFVKGYDSVYNHGYGEPSGALGINCSHWHFTVYVPYESTVNVRKVDPSEAVRRYGLQQKQRAMERAIRLTKQKLALAAKLNDDDGAKHFGQQLRNQQAAIREYVKSNDLVRQYQNEQS